MTGHYQPWIVALSAFVAIATAYASLSLSARVVDARGVSARLWLAGGAVTMGTGIWAMHFIGMMAFRLPIVLAYDIPTTALSWLVAVGGSAFVLRLVRAPSLSGVQLVQGATAFGGGISAMHYIGMAATTLVPRATFDPTLVLLSVAIAMLASLGGLFLTYRLRGAHSWQTQVARAGGAGAIGLAICTMHYTGMAATHIAPAAFCRGGVALDQSALALIIAMVALGLMAVLALIMMVDGHIASRMRRYADELELANVSLQRAATHDSLTGLPNRSLLMQRIEEALRGARRTRSITAVMVIDVDRFKSVNDSFGHLAGDTMLRVVATRISAMIRSGDTLARLGGDEFVLVANDLRDRAHIESLARRMGSVVAEPLMLGGVELKVSLSIGIAISPTDGRDPTMLLKNADSAMYFSKKAGRDTYHFFKAEMDNSARERLEMESALRHALANQEFVVHYQPRVDAISGFIEGAEALIRWNHGTRGLVPPSDFIPIAEECGMIVPIGEWILRQACQQLSQWHRAGHKDLRMAVNLSAEQFRQANLLQMVQSALADAGLEPSHLELELTETAVMRDTAQSVRVLGELALLGVTISVDDFGTGYSSLSYLRRLPLHRLKIDRSFIADVGRNPEDAEIVRAIVSLAHSLNLHVTAEGVETAQQLEFIRSLRCDEYQGYLFSRPMIAADFLAKLGPASPTNRKLRALGNTAITTLRMTALRD